MVIAAPVYEASATMQGARRHCSDGGTAGMVVKSRWEGRIFRGVESELIERAEVGERGQREGEARRIGSSTMVGGKVVKDEEEGGVTEAG